MGLVPGIHVGPTPESLQESLKRRPDVDGRDKPGHDDFFTFQCLKEDEEAIDRSDDRYGSQIGVSIP